MTPLWLADPLAGVVVWGSAGIVAWTILAAFVGSVLGTLRDSGTTRLEQSPHGTRQRPRRLRVVRTIASPEWQPAK